jgi:hypothetical protein
VPVCSWSINDHAPQRYLALAWRNTRWTFSTCNLAAILAILIIQFDLADRSVKGIQRG